MATTFRPRTLVLFLGDLLSFILALYGALFLRAFEAPSQQLFVAHLYPFSLLFVVWVGVFFIAGLYENRSIILARRALSTTLLIAQTFNIAIAALFFFFVPLFGISPKTILFIYLAVSFLLILLWRAGLFPLLRSQEPAILVGSSAEALELAAILQAAHRAPTRVAEVIDPSTPGLSATIIRSIEQHGARVVIADWSDARAAQAFPELSKLLQRGIRFFDAVALYEEVFGRIVLRQINDQWIARHVSRYAHGLYDTLKRAMDIVAALVLGVISLAAYPFLILAIKLQDGGPVFYSTTRVGQNNRPIVIWKFRSMSGSDQGAEVLKSKLVVTPVGNIIRKTHMDELPQLWNVLRGDLSLIGPRPELPALVEEYQKHIPYYTLRHLVKPGLSGWARLYHANDPHHATQVEATREKLSYDLYYLKHRSLVLDATIALKTIKKLLTRSGV